MLGRFELVDVHFQKSFVLNRYPREKNQGVAFEKAIAPVDVIISLECSAETMVKRVMHRAAQSEEKRADDNEETIKNRIATFVKNTDDILNQYPSQTRRVIAFISSFAAQIYITFEFRLNISFLSLSFCWNVQQIDGQRDINSIFVDVSTAIDEALAQKSTAAAAAAIWTIYLRESLFGKFKVKFTLYFICHSASTKWDMRQREGGTLFNTNSRNGNNYMYSTIWIEKNKKKKN